MANPIRSANNAYYASKQPLAFRGLREGRKSPPPARSYQHKGNDSTASSDKYYAEPKQEQPAKQAPQKLVKNAKTIELKPKMKALPEVVAAFQNGATEVTVKGTATDINAARSAVDMAVGRNTLTREQADMVSFVAEPLKEAPTNKETSKSKANTKTTTNSRSKKTTAAAKSKNKTKAVKEKAAEDNTDTDIDAILNPPTEDKEESVESDWADEDDIAKAFGVDKEESDDSFDDDSDD